MAVHGRYSYLRNTAVVEYSIYKNALVSLSLFYFAFYNGFSGQLLYDSWLFTLYNIVFTSWPPLIIGFFERDVDPEVAMELFSCSFL